MTDKYTITVRGRDRFWRWFNMDFAYTICKNGYPVQVANSKRGAKCVLRKYIAGYDKPPVIIFEVDVK
jgi:hypothetical protein